MSGFRLTLRAPLTARVDASSLLPSTLAGAGPSDVAARTVPFGAGTALVGDLFEVVAAEEAALVFTGDPRLDYVAAGLAAGEVRVEGDAGASAGAGMGGGRLVITGDAGDGLAAGLIAGRIDVFGNAGAHVGGPKPGERQGMRGGVVSIAGAVGEGLGARLRGGLILVGGDTGPRAGDGLLAGTLAVAGRLGPGAGRGMKRGSILVPAQPEALAPGFAEAGPQDFVALKLLARRVPELAALFGGRLTGRALRLVGNRLAGGEGEILVLS